MMSYSGVCLKFSCLIAPLLFASTISHASQYRWQDDYSLRRRWIPFELEDMKGIVELVFDFRKSKFAVGIAGSVIEDFKSLVDAMYSDHPSPTVRESARKLAEAYIKKMDPDGDGNLTMPDLSVSPIEEEEEKKDVEDEDHEKSQRQDKDEGEGKEPAKTEDVEDVGTSGEVGLENLTTKT